MCTRPRRHRRRSHRRLGTEPPDLVPGFATRCRRRRSSHVVANLEIRKEKEAKEREEETSGCGPCGGGRDPGREAEGRYGCRGFEREEGGVRGCGLGAVVSNETTRPVSSVADERLKRGPRRGARTAGWSATASWQQAINSPNPGRRRERMSRSTVCMTRPASTRRGGHTPQPLQPRGGTSTSTGPHVIAPEAQACTSRVHMRQPTLCPPCTARALRDAPRVIAGQAHPARRTNARSSHPVRSLARVADERGQE